MARKHLRSRLRDYYIHRLGYTEKVQISNLVHINAGWESEIYAFDLLHGSGESQNLILRIYPGLEALEKSEREFTNLKRLVDLNFPVPKAYQHEGDISILGAPFVIMERISGEMLWKVLFSSERTNRDNAELIDSFNQLFVRLHQLDFHHFVNHREYALESGDLSLISSQLEIWRAVYDSHPLPDFLPLMDWLEAHFAELNQVFPAVLHWDFHPENIILQPDGLMFVIDWTGLQVSDLRFDLAWTLMLITAYEGERWRRTFLKSYEQAAGRPIPEMEFFDVAACIRRLFSIAGSIAEGAGKLGMRPGAEEIMRNQIEPTRVVYDMLLKRTGIDLPMIEDCLCG